MSRRPYVRKVERSWWLQHPRYVAYMIRELTSLFVGLYCALLAIGLIRLAQGHAACTTSGGQAIGPACEGRGIGQQSLLLRLNPALVAVFDDQSGRQMHGGCGHRVRCGCC